MSVARKEVEAILGRPQHADREIAGMIAYLGRTALLAMDWAEDLMEQLAIAHRTRDGLATRAEKAEAEAVQLRERIVTLEAHLTDAHNHLAEAHQDNDALRRENTELRGQLACAARLCDALDEARKDAPDAH